MPNPNVDLLRRLFNGTDTRLLMDGSLSGVIVAVSQHVGYNVIISARHKRNGALTHWQKNMIIESAQAVGYRYVKSKILGDVIWLALFERVQTTPGEAA